MGRIKSNRNISFKPLFKSFVPQDRPYEGMVKLLDEEIEAIYLMDIKGCYQEKAAQQMNVSRPTFTRILKNARKKLTSAIVSGSKIEIESVNDTYIVALCANEKIENLNPLEEYIYIFKNIENSLELIEKIENPAYDGKNKVAQTLPKILLEKNVNIFVTSKVGTGLKNSLISNGISINLKNKIDINSFSV